MGNAFKKDEDRWEMQYVKPTGLYSECHWDEKIVKKLILDRKLAPRMLGSEEAFPGSEECPICLLHYQLVNRSRCCKKPICTECFLQIKRPNSGRTTYCPFCNAHRYGVVYLGPMSEDDRRKAQEEEQRVLELKIAMQAEEARAEQERALRRAKDGGVSSSPSLTHPSNRAIPSSSASPHGAAAESSRGLAHGRGSNTASPLQAPSGPPPEFFLPESVAARQREMASRREQERRERGGAEVPAWLQGLDGVDVDELMLMQAIHLSLLDQSPIAEEPPPARELSPASPSQPAPAPAVSSEPLPSSSSAAAAPAAAVAVAAARLASVPSAGVGSQTPERERERERERMLALMLGGDEAPAPRVQAESSSQRRAGGGPAGRVRRYLARMAGRGRPDDRDAFVVHAGGSDDEDEEEDEEEEEPAYGRAGSYNYGYESDEDSEQRRAAAAAAGSVVYDPEFFDRHGAHLLLPSDRAGSSLEARETAHGRVVGSGARRRVVYRRDGEEDEVGADDHEGGGDDEALSPIATPPFAATAGAFAGGSPQRPGGAASNPAHGGVEMDEEAQLALALRLSLLTAEQEEAERRMLGEAGVLPLQDAAHEQDPASLLAGAAPAPANLEAASTAPAEDRGAAAAGSGSPRQAAVAEDAHGGAGFEDAAFPPLEDAQVGVLPRTPSPLPSPRLETLSPGLLSRPMAFGEGPSSPLVIAPSPLPMSPVRLKSAPPTETHTAFVVVIADDGRGTGGESSSSEPSYVGPLKDLPLAEPPPAPDLDAQPAQEEQQ
eukprot:tig00001164_g7404.t1